jgi:hypothetical protein
MKLGFSDDNGQPRLALGLGQQGKAPVLVMFDRTGKHRLKLSLNEATDDVSVTVFDERGLARAELGASSGHSGLALFDVRGEVRVGLSVDNRERPFSEFTDPAGRSFSRNREPSSGLKLGGAFVFQPSLATHRLRIVDRE